MTLIMAKNEETAIQEGRKALVRFRQSIVVTYDDFTAHFMVMDRVRHANHWATSKVLHTIEFDFEVKRIEAPAHKNTFTVVEALMVDGEAVEYFGGDFHWIFEATAKAAADLYRTGLVRHGASVVEVMERLEQKKNIYV